MPESLLTSLLLILAALTAFFTLLTGASAVFVTLCLLFSETQGDREKEIQSLANLDAEYRAEYRAKIRRAEDALIKIGGDREHLR